MRIVAASDGTAPSSIAHQLLATTRWPAGSVVRIVATQEAVRGPAQRSRSGAASPMSAPSVDDTTALAMLEDLAPQLRRAGVDVELVASHGPARAALFDSARKASADLILVGGHLAQARAERTKPLDLELLGGAPCPVLVARAPTVTRILLAVDRSSAARAIPRILGRWHVFTNAPIDVVSVAEPSSSEFLTPWAFPVAPHLDRERHRGIAYAAASELVRLGWDAAATMHLGLSAREIVAVAEDLAVDLIVIPAHGDARPLPAHLGEVAREVLDRTQGSVLVIGERRSRPRTASRANGVHAACRHRVTGALTRS